MRVKEIVFEDFVNYRKASMFIGTISCNGKCCTEAGIPLSICQNDAFRACQAISIDNHTIINKYLNNPITSAIVFGGLEPFEQYNEVYHFIREFRECSDDDVVIYTGYYKDEIKQQVDQLAKMKNIIIKFGRFIPNQESHRDQVLGVMLASDNQYGERIG